MLLSFRAANHRSLRDEQQLLLTPSDADDTADWEALPVAGIFGANASGKSNVLDALAYMLAMVRGSFPESEPGAGIERHPFALDPAMRDEPSVFVVDLLLDGMRYTYGFAVDDSHVLEEWMYSHPQKQQQTIFHRKEDIYSYGEQTPGSIKQAEEITDPNVLFISVAARSRQPILRPVYTWFRDLSPLVQADFLRRRYRPSIFGLLRVSEVRYLDRISTLLNAADTGIESAKLVEETDEELRARTLRFPDGEESRTRRRRRVFFNHRSDQGVVPLSLEDQSEGTQAIYSIGIKAFAALDAGLPLIVDELNSSLHPFLTAQLIGLFRNPETNSRGAQLIFTSHDATLLGRIQGEVVLHRDHIWFTEKSESGATELFPLSEFEPPQEDNRGRRYLAGRYGAVPVVNDELFAAAVAARRDVDDESDR